MLLEPLARRTPKTARVPSRYCFKYAHTTDESSSRACESTARESRRSGLLRKSVSSASWTSRFCSTNSNCADRLEPSGRLPPNATTRSSDDSNVFFNVACWWVTVTGLNCLEFGPLRKHSKKWTMMSMYIRLCKGVPLVLVML